MSFIRLNNRVLTPFTRHQVVRVIANTAAHYFQMGEYIRLTDETSSRNILAEGTENQHGRTDWWVSPNDVEPIPAGTIHAWNYNTET